VKLFMVMSLPKFKTNTDAPVFELYIKAPRAVIEELGQVALLNEIQATLLAVSWVGGLDMVKGMPPAVYPLPVATSPTGVYAAVVLFRLASAVYKAILYVYGDVKVKFSKPLKTLALNAVV